MSARTVPLVDFLLHIEHFAETRLEHRQHPRHLFLAELAQNLFEFALGLLQLTDGFLLFFDSPRRAALFSGFLPPRACDALPVRRAGVSDALLARPAQARGLDFRRHRADRQHQILLRIPSFRIVHSGRHGARSSPNVSDQRCLAWGYSFRGTNRRTLPDLSFP